MKVVIDIPEDVYKRTVFYREFKDLNDCVTTIKALEKGKPLPAKHGRLIDADALPISHGVFVPRVPNRVILGTPMDTVFVDEIKDAPTIIEGSDSE
jgi:hypothetical protein